MHSIPFAEPLGILTGTLAGRFGAEFGKDVARKYGWPSAVCAGVGACIAHYLAGAATRTVLNVTVLDVPGTAVSVAWTTPMASVAHGVVEGVWEALA